LPALLPALLLGLLLGLLLAGPIAAAASAQDGLPDLDGREVVIVTENAYLPLQFVDPGTGEAISWECDAVAELAERLNFAPVYENASWDAMIPAVATGQFDMGMTGMTGGTRTSCDTAIRSDRGHRQAHRRFSVVAGDHRRHRCQAGLAHRRQRPLPRDRHRAGARHRHHRLRHVHRLHAGLPDRAAARAGGPVAFGVATPAGPLPGRDPARHPDAGAAAVRRVRGRAAVRAGLQCPR